LIRSFGHHRSCSFFQSLLILKFGDLFLLDNRLHCDISVIGHYSADAEVGICGNGVVNLHILVERVGVLLGGRYFCKVVADADGVLIADDWEQPFLIVLAVRKAAANRQLILGHCFYYELLYLSIVLSNIYLCKSDYKIR